MGWSTSELAEMAGTTVNTIRHYHRVGLLDQPERRGNGYKQYQARHLARVLQIRRLREMGVPLARVDRMGDSPADSKDALRALDAELAAGIERLRRARQEVAALLREGTPTDVPAGFEGVAERLSDADRAVIAISSRFYDERAVEDLRTMIDAEPTDLDHEMNTLPPDASADTRQRLAERVAVILEEHRRNHPWLSDPGSRLTMPQAVVEKAAMMSVTDLYNEAQQDVMRRALLILEGEPE